MQRKVQRAVSIGTYENLPSTEFGVDSEMDIKLSKADSVWPFELGVRRLHTPDLLQTYKAHLSFFMYDVYGIMYAR